MTLMPWIVKPHVLYWEAAEQITRELAAQGVELTDDQARELARAKLGPSKRWTEQEDPPEPPEDDPVRVALRGSRDKPGRVPWWVEVARHHGHKHAHNSPCDMPNWVEGWPHPQDPDHRQMSADHRRPSVDEPITPEILEPGDAAGLDEGQTSPPRRVRRRRNRSPIRSISYVSSNEDDEWTPM